MYQNYGGDISSQRRELMSNTTGEDEQQVNHYEHIEQPLTFKPSIGEHCNDDQSEEENDEE